MFSSLAETFKTKIKMKDQKIFRVSAFGHLAAIASVTDDNKVWVRYYHGMNLITDIQNGGFNYRFIEEVNVQILEWAEKENNYTLWSF